MSEFLLLQRMYRAIDPIFSPQDIANIRAEDGAAKLKQLEAVSATSEQSERGALNDAFRDSSESECQPLEFTPFEDAD